MNAAFVRRFLPGDLVAALGRRLASGTRSPQGEEPAWREIVGVIGDVRHLGFEREADPAVYVPFAQQPIPLVSLAVRTAGDTAALAPPLRRAVWAEDPKQPVAFLMPLAELAGESLALRPLSALLAGAFAVVALGLATLGAYGVVAQVVGHGTREIGVRLALGANASSVVRGVLREALSAAAVGAFAAAALVGAAGLAAWLPVRRAALIDPAVVLRQE